MRKAGALIFWLFVTTFSRPGFSAALLPQRSPTVRVVCWTIDFRESGRRIGARHGRHEPGAMGVRLGRLRAWIPGGPTARQLGVAHATAEWKLSRVRRSDTGARVDADDGCWTAWLVAQAHWSSPRLEGRTHE